VSAWALGSPGTGQQEATPAPAQKPAEKAAARPHFPDFVTKTAVADAPASPSPGVEARLADLERKIDLLLRRLNPPPNVPEPFDQSQNPQQARNAQQSNQAGASKDSQAQGQQSNQAGASKDSQTQGQQGNQAGASKDQAPSVELPEPSLEVANFPRSARTRPDPFEAPAPQRSSLKEIEAQIQIARQHFERSKTLYAAAAIGKEAYEAPLDQIRLLIARLEGMDEDFADELERFKVEIGKKQAQLKLAEAQRTTTVEALTWKKQLVERNLVSKGDVSKTEAEDTVALARIEVQRSELQDVHLRMQQVTRRREMIKRDVNEVLKAIPEIARERGPTPDAGDFDPRVRRLEPRR